jgi:flagellar protein FliL
MSETSTEDEEEKSGGGLVKIILIVLVVLLLMVGTAVGTMFATGFFDEKPESEDPETALQDIESEIEETDGQVAESLGPKTAEIEQKFVISYYTFEDAFQVNLKGSKKMMQAKLGITSYFDKDIMFNQEEGTEGWVPRHLVGIRAAILKLLRNVSADKFDTPEGEQEVLEELRLVINEQLEKHEKTSAAPIEEVHFTELIVQ